MLVKGVGCPVPFAYIFLYLHHFAVTQILGQTHLSVETLSSQQIELLSEYLDDWENISFEDKRKAADGLISSISATSDYVKIEWKI